MAEDPKMGSGGEAASGEGEDTARRISLRRIDALLQGEISEREAAALRRSLAEDPAAAAYLERQSALRSTRSLADLQAALRERSRKGAMNRALSWFASAPGSAPRSAWMPAVVFAGLVLGVSVWISRLPSGVQVANRHSPKGLEQPEIALRFRGSDYSPGDLVPARTGDTLSFAYRSGDSLRVQIWYQEEGGVPAPMTGPGGFSLPPATSWEEAHRKIRLEGSWQRQQIWILLSRKVLDPAQAADAVRLGRGDRDLLLAGYRLAAPTGE